MAPLLDSSTAVELIPELVRHGLQQLIELEDAAVVGAQCHEQTEEHLCLLNDYNPRTLTTRVVMVTMEAYIAWASNTPWLAPVPLQSEALLRSGLCWERSRRRACWRVP